VCKAEERREQGCIRVLHFEQVAVFLDLLGFCRQRLPRRRMNLRVDVVVVVVDDVAVVVAGWHGRVVAVRI